jgi:hypothetical protein
MEGIRYKGNKNSSSEIPIRRKPKGLLDTQRKLKYRKKSNEAASQPTQEQERI